MSTSGFSDETVKQKLMALNESQESIVTVAQWIMFHKRQAKKTAELWLQRMEDPNSNASKRLNLVYLANEVVQQSKARKREEFREAFNPCILQGTIKAYKGAPSDIQNKLKRVSEVWRQRQIFDAATQEGLEAQMMELDKARPQPQRKTLGGSLFPPDNGVSSIPSELQPVVQIQQLLSRAQLGVKPAIDSATKDYETLTSRTTPLPSPPLYAGRLNALGKQLETAESALTEALKTRQRLIAGLEKLLESNHAALTNEEEQRAEIHKRRQEIETKKENVEDAIMRGLSGTDALSHHATRPEIERFTPPPPSPDSEAAIPPGDVPRSFTPPGLPSTHQDGAGLNGADQQGKGSRTLDAVEAQPQVSQPSFYDGGYEAPERETLTPPLAPTRDSAGFEPEYRTHDFATAPAAVAVRPLPGIPGLGQAMKTDSARSVSADTKKRPSSAVNAGLDPRRRTGSSSASPAKRQRTGNDEMGALLGFGGEGALEGLDKEVVGMLG